MHTIYIFLFCVADFLILCSLDMWNNALLNTSMLETYSSMLIFSSDVCEECGSPGPNVITGILKALPNMFISHVPVFRRRMGRRFRTSSIESDSARTRGEE